MANSEYQARYVLEQRLKNVTIEILKDQMTGEYSIGWYRQDDTEDITYDCEENYD
jgi:hypothetical protein